MSRSALLALACAVVGLLVGRALPRGGSTPEASATAAPAPMRSAPSACGPERTRLASLRTQLAICNARLVQAMPDAGAVTVDPATPAEPPSYPPLASPSLPSMFPDLPTVGPVPDLPPPPLTERVIVRHRDGSVSSQQREDWPADTDEGKVIARSYSGRWGYFAPDAGPDDPAMALHDLAGPDGMITLGRAGGRVHFSRRPDAGAP